MKKPFCDICGSPAPVALERINTEYAFGPEYRTVQADAGSSGCTERTVRKNISIDVVMNLREGRIVENTHPDICKTCSVKILEALLAGFKEQEIETSH